MHGEDARSVARRRANWDIHAMWTPGHLCFVEHRRRRLAAIEAAVRQGAGTLYQIAQALPWKRPWSTFSVTTKRSALAETFAHVRHLERKKRLVRVGDIPPWVFDLFSGQ
jgi:hypothetical protein